MIKSRLLIAAMLIALSVTGIGISLEVGNRIETQARAAWHEQARREAATLTEIANIWIEQMRANLGAVATVFRIVPRVTADVFETATATELDSDLPAGATAYALRVGRVQRPGMERDLGKRLKIVGQPDKLAPSAYAGYAVIYSTIPEGVIAVGTDLASNPATKEAVMTANSRPEDIVVGPTFHDADGRPLALLAVAASRGDVAGTLVRVFDIGAFFDFLFLAQDKSSGLRLRVAQRQTETSAVTVSTPVIGDMMPRDDVAETITFRISHSQARWTLNWDMASDYRGGPVLNTANTVRYGGGAMSVLLATFFAFLGFQNVGIRRRVETRSAELDASRRDKDLLVNAIDGIVWEADAKTFKFTFVSEKAERLLGYPIADWLDDDNFWTSHIHPLDRHWALTYCREATQAMRSHEFEYRMIAADGGIRWLRDLVTVHSEHGRPVRLQGIMVDITEQKEIEEQLRAAKEQAELGNRAKSEFLANMSHELRTPLNAIIGFSQMMREEVLGPIGVSRYKGYVDDIHISGNHLLELINDILDLSKVEAGKLELIEEDIDVCRVVSACLTLVRERAGEAGVVLDKRLPDRLPRLHADERKLKQVLLNLLSNAIKFTPKGGRVMLRVHADPGEGFVFTVDDTGIGIASEDMPKVLAPFGQVDSALSRKYEGTGLGLPLTKALIELHGGSLDLESTLGAGTTITARFPHSRIVVTSATVAA